jgi:hypothetical protein
MLRELFFRNAHIETWSTINAILGRYGVLRYGRTKSSVKTDGTAGRLARLALLSKMPFSTKPGTRSAEAHR